MENSEFWQSADANVFPAATYFEYDYTAEDATIDPGLLQTFAPAFALPPELQDLAMTNDFALLHTFDPAPLDQQGQRLVGDQSWPGQSFASDPEPPAQYVFFFVLANS